MPLRLVVLVSGTGSNLRALIEATRDESYPARVVAVGADREAPGLQHARDADIPTFVVPFGNSASRGEWGDVLLERIQAFDPSLVVLSGFMRLLPSRVVETLSPRLVNTHPAFLPEFPGAHGVRDALAAGVEQTGASLIVVDDGVDAGPVIVQERVPVLPGDSEETLHERIKTVERRLLIQAVHDIATGTIDLEEHLHA